MIYRDQLRQNALVKRYLCDIDIAHLITYDEELADKLMSEPGEIIPLVSRRIVVVHRTNAASSKQL